MDPMVTPDQLSEFPGNPFAASLVGAASDYVRSATSWHIAPKITETRRLVSPGGTLLKLPTLLLDLDEPVEVFTKTRRWTAAAEELVAEPNGLLWGNWPRGSISVTFTHGHASCPAELLPVLAELAQTFARDRTVKQESILSRSVAFGTPDGHSIQDVIARYRL